MEMKQTQTKLFDFSDVGLDFCAGSKNLFPDRFKKMLSLGYNVQTVTSVAVAGNQVTFTYGGAHGYAADRVLKVDSGALSFINGGEFYIDSVTTNTVTMTINDAPLSAASGFTTKIAPLGWELVYEQPYIHVYKFKSLDESDLYLRLCFQDVLTARNCIAPCIGKSVNLITGEITDANTLTENAVIASPGTVTNGFRWEMSSVANTTSNNYNYSQGFATFGKAMVVGSLYHFVMMTSNNQQASWGRVAAILPCVAHLLHDGYPVLVGERSGGGSLQLSNAESYIGAVRVVHQQGATSTMTLFATPQALNSFTNLDNFNTTTAEPIPVYEAATKQHLGFVIGGMYVAKYASSNTPTLTGATSPSLTKDVDLQNLVAQHYIASGTTAQNAVFFAVPVEEIKVA